MSTPNRLERRATSAAAGFFYLSSVFVVPVPFFSHSFLYPLAAGAPNKVDFTFTDPQSVVWPRVRRLAHISPIQRRFIFFF